MQPLASTTNLKRGKTLRPAYSCCGGGLALLKALSLHTSLHFFVETVMSKFNHLTALILIVGLSQVAFSQSLDLPSPSESFSIGDAMVDSGPVITDTVFDPSGAVVEGPVEPGTWYNPMDWFAGPYWEKGIELGINGSKGNAEAISILAAGRLRRETDRSIWGIDMVYAKTEAADVLTQHYAFLNSRFDYKIGDSRWTLWNITRLEYDEFKAFDLRLAINGGLGYDFIRTEQRKLTGRFGAGASREFGGGNEEWVPEAVFGADYIHKISDRQRLAITSDYYPSWEDFKDYRLVTQASWELVLDEETNLSLKIGILDRYDSTPGGLEPNDLDYFITLLWKI